MMTNIDPIEKLLSGLLGPETSQNPTIWLVFRLLLALVFGAVIGCERATKRHSAGLRTFTVVSVTSAAAMIIDSYLHVGNVPILSAAVVISVAILSGNSVLFSSRSQIKGLTTSVSLWGISILGIACGAGLFTLAIALFIVLMALLAWLSVAEKYLKDRSNHFEIHLELKSTTCLQDFVTTIRKLGLAIDDIESNPAYANSGLSVYTVAITIKSGELKQYKTHKEIIQALGTLEYVYHIEEMRT